MKQKNSGTTLSLPKLNMCLYSWVYSFGIHKPYALQDTGYTKMNEHIFKEQVILMLKDKER